MFMTATQIGEAMLSAKAEPMSEDQSRIMISLLMPQKAGASILKDAQDAPLPFSYQVLSKRAEWAGVSASEAAMFMLAAMSKNPGDCVLYTTALKVLNDRFGRMVTLDDICEEFPWGFPTDAERLRIWDAQKSHDDDGPTDNSVDNPRAWGMPVAPKEEI